MESEQFELAATLQMDRRQDKADEFYQAAFDAVDQPWFVSDIATLYDIVPGDEAEVVTRCHEHYGVQLRREHFSLPFWQLLDYLETNRRKPP